MRNSSLPVEPRQYVYIFETTSIQRPARAAVERMAASADKIFTKGVRKLTRRGSTSWVHPAPHTNDPHHVRVLILHMDVRARERGWGTMGTLFSITPLLASMQFSLSARLRLALLPAAARARVVDCSPRRGNVVCASVRA